MSDAPMPLPELLAAMRQIAHPWQELVVDYHHPAVEALALLSSQIAAHRREERERHPNGGMWCIGQRVTKLKGSSWTGKIVGFYVTKLTPIGYCVESENEPGSTQIYPEAALSALIT